MIPTTNTPNSQVCLSPCDTELIQTAAVSDFEIRSIEWMEHNSPMWNKAPIKSDRFQLVWIKQGKGTLRVDCKSFDIQQDMMYCLAPGRHCQFHIDEGCTGYYISFAPEFVHLKKNKQDGFIWFEEYENFINTPIVHVDKDISYEMEEIIRFMQKELGNPGPVSTDILKGLLNIFVLYFSKKIKTASDPLLNRDQDLAKKFMTLLRGHTSKKMVCDYADELNVSPNYLNRTIKKVSGFTASHHIQQQIILEAKRHAIYSGISMKEIAYALGFDNLAHFSKFFKSKSGMNFSNFKKEQFSIAGM